MAGRGPLHCLLLVLLVTYAAASPKTSRKPGRCPPAPKYTCFVTPLPNPCKSNDFNCPGDKKCCLGGCGTSCMKPQSTGSKKPGRCPPVPLRQCRRLNPPDRCQSNDFNCPDNQKCCRGTCGKICVKPFKKRKPGNCPPVRGQCRIANPPDRCESDDYKCPGKQKCCTGICGKNCITPATKKPGRCPPIPEIQCLTINPPDKCRSNDFNCPGRKKCCKGGCGKFCMEPASSKKPGRCPPIPEIQCLMINPPNKCKSNDFNCPGRLKCCQGNCGTACMKPVPSKKPGKCPPIPEIQCLTINPPDKCRSNDFNCPGRKKCCKGGCGKFCMEPASSKKPGRCPPTPLIQCAMINPPDNCKSNDFNCPKNQKCCTGSCGKSCVKPIKEQKPGGCPPVSPFQCDEFPLPDKCKSDDNNCPGDQKCCKGFCGKSCTNPRTEKAGRCPKPPLYTCLLHPLPNPCKSSDYNCSGRKKCCRGGCGSSCMYPVPEKSGCCPKPPAEQCDQYPLPDPCSSLDSNCPGLQKCCPGACGNSCVKPLPLPQDKPEC